MSVRAQLLWATMARPVLSGTCPVKLLYCLGHLAAAQFQGLGNLLIAYASGGRYGKNMISQFFFRKITIHDFITILCHVGFYYFASCLSSTAKLISLYKAFQGNEKRMADC